MIREIPISFEVMVKLGIDWEEFKENPESFRPVFNEWLKTEAGQLYARQTQASSRR